MTGLSALSGYVMTKDKEWLSFSIITNGFVGESAKEVENEICAYLQDSLTQ